MENWGKYVPTSQTRSGRNTQKPQWLTQERPDGADAIKRMKPEERLKLLKKTLEKSTKLTQKLLKKLGSEWDDVFKEDDSDDGRASGHSSRRNSDDSDSSVKSIENITDVMNRRTKMRMTRSATGTRRSNRIINYVDNSSSEDDDEGVARGKRNSRKQFESKRRGKVSYKETSSNDATPAASSDEDDTSQEDDEENDDKPRPKRFKRLRSDEGSNEDEDRGKKNRKGYDKPRPKRFKKSRSSDDDDKGKKNGNGKKFNVESSDDEPLVNKKKSGKPIENGNGVKKEDIEDKENLREKIKKEIDDSFIEDEENIGQDMLKELNEEGDALKEENGHPVKQEVNEDKDDEENSILNRHGREWEGQPIAYEQPLLIRGGVMKPYQIEGMIWMANLRRVKANGILADEMGLGKTLQTISLFCHTYEVDKKAGPFLVIAPLSTLLNWKREVERFAPGVPAKLLYPAGAAVEEWDNLEDRHPSPLGQGKTMGTIYITSYETAVALRSMLQTVKWNYIVVDEGHRLKNRNCRLGKELRKIPCKYRMLLTGTPLQNDMEELWSLLNFLQPDLFDNYELFADWFDARKLDKMKREGATALVLQEQKNNILAQIHRIIGPFILRRKKADVDLSILPKKEVLVYCPFTPTQSNLYMRCVKRLQNDKKWAAGQECLGGAMGQGFQMQYLMDLRTACNHPYIGGNLGDDPGDEVLIDSCGKMQVLHQMIKRLGDDGHKTLIFSQFTRVLDIIELSLKFKGYKFCRLDGQTKLDDRQEEIERFYKEQDTKLFLLSTRAGGLGINLIAADTCIIYDSDWNPQQDLQAQDRCHRIGQTRPVVIFRLVTQNTIDEAIVQRAQAKRSIEKLIIHQDKFKSGQSNLKETTEKVLSPKEILQTLLNKDDINTLDASSADQYGLEEKQLEQLMDRSDIVKEWMETKRKRQEKEEREARNVNINCDGMIDIGSVEDEDDDVLETIFDCIICRRPFLCKPSVLIKMCGRPRCRFSTDRLRKARVLLDRRLVDKYYNEDGEDSEAERAKKELLEKAKLKKKRLHNQRMKKKKQAQNQGYLGELSTITSYNKAGKIERIPMPKVRPPPKARQPLQQNDTEVVDLASDNEEDGNTYSNGIVSAVYCTWEKASEHFDYNPLENRYTCKLDGRSFSRRDKALNYYRDHHLEADYVFVCTFCTPEKKFETGSALYNHLRGSKHYFEVKMKDLDGFMRKRDTYVEVKAEPKPKLPKPKPKPKPKSVVKPKPAPKSAKPKPRPKSASNGKKVNGGGIYQIQLVDSSDDNNEEDDDDDEEEDEEESDEDNYYEDDSDSPIEIIMPSKFS